MKTMDVTLRSAAKEDVAELSALNRLLREDEKMDNEMSDDEICKRMESFITGDVYKVHVLENNAKDIIGYCVLDITRSPNYMRQLFIKREYRNHGYGRMLLEKAMEEHQLNEIDLEVMIWNEGAIRFYEHIGFKPRYMGMRFKKES